jgi:apolipoprotein N-acyltransferase
MKSRKKQPARSPREPSPPVVERSPQGGGHSGVRHKILLCVLSGALLGLSFPPVPLGILACVGLIPLLVVLSETPKMWASLRYGYVAMLVFHVITVNWTGGYSHGNDPYMMIAGGVTMLVHPLFYWVPLSVYVAVRRGLGERAALVALPAIWVSYEYLHSLSEWSFPWLTLGNSQTYDLNRIQFISATGVYGLSLWILVLNVIGFLLVRSLLNAGRPKGTRHAVVLASAFVVLYMLPMVHGMVVLSRHPAQLPSANTNSSITIGVVQPNLDPWDKWNRGGSSTIGLYLRETQRLVDSVPGARPELVLWPETAIPVYLIARGDTPILREFKTNVARLGVSILSGLPQAVFYPDTLNAPRTARRSAQTGERYDIFNAAALFTPGSDSIPWYGKMKMVPIAERIPYAEIFSFIDFLRWDVGIGGWQIGRDSTLFTETKTGARFSTMICYESVYPSFVASFVRRGAEFITIITVDSWWGKMSGAYQHMQFAILRAVENRRWIARCALGGISAYIDPYGRTYDRTDLMTTALLSKTIGREHELTMYTHSGDWLSEFCLVLTGMFLAASLGRRFHRRRRQLEDMQ